MDVEMPDGTTVTGVPEGTTKAQLMAKMGQQAPTSATATPQPGTDPYAEQPFPMGRTLPDGTQVAPNRPQGELDAYKAGVDINQPTPPGLELGKEAFSSDAGAWRDYVQGQLYKSLGPTADLRLGPQSRKMEFWDDKQQKWALLNNTDFGQKLLSHADTVMSLVGGAGAAVAAAAEGPIGAIGLGALGEGAGGMGMEYLRLKIGDQLGINGGDESSRMLRSAKVGAVNAAGSAVFSTGFNLARYVKKAFKGAPVLTESQAQGLLNDMGQYQPLVDEINANSDIKFNPLIHQTARKGSPHAEIAETLYRKVEADPKLASEVAQQRSNTWGALESYFENASRPAQAPGIPATAAGRAEAGAPTAQGIQQGRTAMADDIRAQHATNVAQAQTQTQQLANGVRGSMSDGGRAVRDQIWAQRTESKMKVKEAYQKFESLTGYNPDTGLSAYSITLPKDSEIGDLVNKFGRDTAVGDLKGATNVTGDTKYTFDPNTKLLVKGKLPDTVDVNLATLDKTAKRLDELYRNKAAGGNDVGYSQYDLVQAREKILDKMAETLKTQSANGQMPPDTYAAYVQARHESKRDANLFKQGFLADFLKKNEAGSWVVNDQDALGAILVSKDLQAARQLRDMIDGDPVAINETKKAIFALYNQKVVKNGIPSLDAHREFMRTDGYGDIMDIFFKDADVKFLNKYEDVATSLAGSEAKAQRAEQLARTAFGGPITRWTPEQIISKVLSKTTSSDQAEKLMTMSRGFGDGSAEKLRNGVANDIQLKLYPDGPEGRMNLSSLNKLIDDAGENIQTVMGQDYITALRRLRDAVPVLERNPLKFSDPPINSRLQKIGKQYFGPFSGEGRGMTLLGMFRKENLGANIWRALTNPQELTRLANLSRVATRRTVQAGIAGGEAAAIGQEEYRD